MSQFLRQFERPCIRIIQLECRGYEFEARENVEIRRKDR